MLTDWSYPVMSLDGSSQAYTYTLDLAQFSGRFVGDLRLSYQFSAVDRVGNMSSSGVFPQWITIKYCIPKLREGKSSPAELRHSELRRAPPAYSWFESKDDELYRQKCPAQPRSYLVR